MEVEIKFLKVSWMILMIELKILGADLYRDGVAGLVNVQSAGSRERVISPVVCQPVRELAAPVSLSH